MTAPFSTQRRSAQALALVDDVLEPEAPFHIHFSDIAFANRNETKHLPYGEGTLRAEPLRDALAGFDRPATVISESPDEESSQAIRSVLLSVTGDELGNPRFVDRRVLVPTLAAQELGDLLERMELEDLVVRLPGEIDRRDEELLRLAVPPLRLRGSSASAVRAKT